MPGAKKNYPGKLMRQSEMQRRGMAATRKKAQKKRPNRPMTLQQLRQVRQRDMARRQDEMLNSPQARRARERMRSQY